MIHRLTDALNFQSQALALRSDRQRLLASNIANADTPGYEARDFDFARALKDATSAADGATGGAGSRAAALRQDAQLRWATNAQTNLDRNTVDMDRERAAFAENGLKYDAALRFLNGQIRSIQEAMKGHNQG